jgi:hypothetical protein
VFGAAGRKVVAQLIVAEVAIVIGGIFRFSITGYEVTPFTCICVKAMHGEEKKDLIKVLNQSLS